MSSSTLTIPTLKVFEPLLAASRFKGAFGGRASGKSHFFAEMGVERCLLRTKSRGVCVREVQKSLKESAKRLIEDKIQTLGVGGMFDIREDFIRTPGGGVVLFQGMQDHTAESIKSLEGFDWAWVEEAQTLSARSLEMLRPTIRAPGSEIWFSWNPRNASDPVDKFLRQNTPKEAIVVRTNYRDLGSLFPAEMETERLIDLERNRDRYAHIWDGEYEPMAIGAIWDRVTIENNRRAEAPTLARILVSVDPAVSNEEDSNEHGIGVAGLGEDGHGYVLSDDSCHGGPRDWATRAVAAYDFWGADGIVIETNQGGDMCRATLQSVRRTVPIIDVKATRGKHIRAEPIAALYTLGRVHHVGTFPQLEDQMCLMTNGGYEGTGSPDRVDWLVWALTQLFPRMTMPDHRKQTMPKQANSTYSPHRWRQ